MQTLRLTFVQRNNEKRNFFKNLIRGFFRFCTSCYGFFFCAHFVFLLISCTLQLPTGICIVTFSISLKTNSGVHYILWCCSAKNFQSAVIFVLLAFFFYAFFSARIFFCSRTNSVCLESVSFKRISPMFA